MEERGQPSPQQQPHQQQPPQQQQPQPAGGSAGPRPAGGTPQQAARGPAQGGPSSSMASPTMGGQQQQQYQGSGGGRGGPPPPSYREYPSAGGAADERRPLKRDLRRDEEYQAIGHEYPNVVDDDDDDERREAKEAGTLHRIIFWIARAILAPVCSALIILVGLAQWYEYISIDDLQISNYVVASYLIFFGLLFLLCEVTDWGLRSYFGLLFAYTGRGLAYIFCGSLSFGMANERYWPLGMAVGFTLLGVGGALIFVGWAFSDLPPLDPWCYSTRVKHLGRDRVEEEREERRYHRDY